MASIKRTSAQPLIREQVMKPIKKKRSKSFMLGKKKK